MTNTTRDTRRDGFTLIELLVVISIIALLVGILLPALGAARRTAQGAVCLGHERSFGQAMAIYATDNNNWLAGPNTSGLGIGLSKSPQNNSNSPAQNVDWISPTLGDALGLPADAQKRMAEISNNDLACPANGENFNHFESYTHPDGLGPDAIKYTSYSATLQFHTFGNTSFGDVGFPSAAFIAPPDNYGPRLDSVGSVSGKIYAMDGARYVAADGKISLNGFERQVVGGNFMEQGPTMGHSNGPFFYTDATGQPLTTGATANWAERFGYRHSGGFNVVFFDGHGENLKPTEAVKVDYWFPTGSVVKRETATKDPNDIRDQVIR